MKERFINWLIKILEVDTNQISDGYHTFGQLYEHRIGIWIALCKQVSKKEPLKVWKSKKHSDGSEIGGWFLLGINTETGKQMTYHLPEKYWGVCRFAQTRATAPVFDGHTPDGVLERVSKL